MAQKLGEILCSRQLLALADLTKALELAEQDGYLLPFVLEADRLNRSLPRMKDLFPSSVDEILPKGTSRPEAGKSGGEDPSELTLAEAVSRREREVLRSISEGLTNQEIAGKLFISEGTVKWHVNNILGKLGVRNRTGAVAKAKSLGLL